MTSLDNALYHARMARVHAESEMSDKDMRTSGVRERMVAMYDKYGTSGSQSGLGSSISQTSSELPTPQLRTLGNLFG